MIVTFENLRAGAAELWVAIQDSDKKRIAKAMGVLQKLLDACDRGAVLSIPMLLWCPECGMRHIDAGIFADKPHHTHACQHCGHCWRPAIVPTTGVQFLPGFKNHL